MSSQPGYIYFLHAVNSDNGNGMERYKIGLTTRYVEDRLKELNSGQSPFWLVEKWSIQVSDCEAAESALHKHFALRRLYFDTSNGQTGSKDDIDPANRKSTEWFMFREDELSAVQESYRNIQNQYPFKMLAPNLRQNNHRQPKQPVQNDRQWRNISDRVLVANGQSPSGGWGWALTLGAVLAVTAIGPRMASFAEDVNTPRTAYQAHPKIADRPKPAPKKDEPNLLQIAGNWLSKVGQKNESAIVINPVNVRIGPSESFALAGNPLPKGTPVKKLEERNGWVRVGDRQWVAGNFIR